MKDYSEMSDFEINCAVALNLGAKDLGDGIFVGEYWRYDIGEHVKNKFKFDPCDSWVDAGPIIQDNLISLSPRCANNEWKASIHIGREDIFDKYVSSWDKNPLRAAMIVFLMMKEGENESN